MCVLQISSQPSWCGKKLCEEVGMMVCWRVVMQDQMLSTAQQMLQDSRSKIELIRLQIIKVTQAGSSDGSSDIKNDVGGDRDSFTHGGQSHWVLCQQVSGNLSVMCQNWVNLEKEVGVIIEYRWKMKNCRPGADFFINPTGVKPAWMLRNKSFLKRLLVWQ